MGKKILVADDDPAILDAIQMLLELEGYDVRTTGDMQTLKTIKKIQPDLLLLDIWMAGIDGREICLQVKKDPITRNIPVVMISASRDITASAKEAGADDFIAKPFEMNELFAKIRKNIKA